MSEVSETTIAPVRHGSPWEVLSAFLKLGLTSFGGPIAHLGYFRDEFVARRRWISEEGYADLVALCQFLPGPASSKVGFALGLLRAGPWGAAAAWIGFTMPSAILLFAFALWAGEVGGPVGDGIVHGLKLVAVAIVAQAIWGMARSLTPDRPRIGIAILALLIVTLTPSAFGQVAAILFGGLAGLRFCRNGSPSTGRHLSFAVPRSVGIAAFALFLVLLLGLPVASALFPSQTLALFQAFYRSGALVFGGGHVVLPLLEAEVVRSGWVSADTFLAGYGAAQAVPGPLFTFAAYLGALVGPEPNGVVGAAISLVALFLPGMLLLIASLPFWNELSAQPWAQSALRGTNAAVVGILGAAFYNPVWRSAVLEPIDFALVAAAFLGLVIWKAPPWTAVLFLAIAGLGSSLIAG